MIHPAFKAIIRDCFLFLLLCVGGISFADAQPVDAEPEVSYINIFQDIRCQNYAAFGGLNETSYSWWLRNSDAIHDPELELTSYDIATIVNQQHDYALTHVLDYMDRYNLSEQEAATKLYMTYCNNM